MSEEKKSNKIFVANLKKFSGQYGTFEKALVNGVSATNADGTPNTFYKGALIWADAATGKNYHIKQMQVMQKKDGTEVLTFDLEDAYQVTPL